MWMMRLKVKGLGRGHTATQSQPRSWKAEVTGRASCRVGGKHAIHPWDASHLKMKKVRPKKGTGDRAWPHTPKIPALQRRRAEGRGP